jgi:hypothetical protein
LRHFLRHRRGNALRDEKTVDAIAMRFKKGGHSLVETLGP